MTAVVLADKSKSVKTHVVIIGKGKNFHGVIDFPIDKKEVKIKYRNNEYILKSDALMPYKKSLLTDKPKEYIAFFKEEDGQPLIKDRNVNVTAETVYIVAQSKSLKQAFVKPMQINMRKLIFISVVLAVFSIVGYLFASGGLKF